MSKYYVAAVIPALVAVVCLVLAFTIWRNTTITPAGTPTLVASKPSPLVASNPTPTPTLRITSPTSQTNLTTTTQMTTTSVPRAFLLPSDCLSQPRPPIRDVRPTALSADLTRTTRVWRQEVHSDDRDREVWPTTAEWKASLVPPLRNVSQVGLDAVALHPSEHTIDVWNNKIDVSIGGVTHTVTVPTGTHIVGSSLAVAVEAAITATHPDLAHITVTYVTLTDTLTVADTTGTPFVLLWRTGPSVNTSCWRTLGFECADATSVTIGTYAVVTSPYRVDLVGPLAIDMFADELRHCLSGPVGRVHLHASSNGAVFQKYTTPLVDAHTFWPLGKLSCLTLRFMVTYVDGEGDTLRTRYRPYVFNGRPITARLVFGCTEYVNPLEADVELDPNTT